MAHSSKHKAVNFFDSKKSQLNVTEQMIKLTEQSYATACQNVHYSLKGIAYKDNVIIWTESDILMLRYDMYCFPV